MKTFHLKGEAATRKVWLNGKALKAKQSQKIINHSPDGFAWGYAGSGPAQLALAICLELFGEKKAIRIYQTFKADIIAAIPMGEDFDNDIEWEP